MTVQRIDSMRSNLTNTNPLQAASTVDTGPPWFPMTVDSEAAQREGDVFMARKYARSLASDSRVSVVGWSTLGRWLEVLNSAVQSPAMSRMSALLGRGEITIEIDAANSSVRFYHRGTLVFGSADLWSIPGGLAILDSLVAAARALMRDGILKIPAFIEGGTLALSDVQRFYGEPANLNEAQKATRLKELAVQPVFKGQGALPDNNVRLELLRMMGDSYTLYNLFDALREQIENTSAGLDLDAVRVIVEPHSSLWTEQQKQPVTVSLKHLIVSLGLQVPATQDQLANLERSLFARPLNAPIEGDHGGLLSKDTPLDEDDKTRLTEVVSAWKTRQPHLPLDKHGRAPSLLEYLQRAVPEDVRARAGDPAGLFDALISSRIARSLGNDLQEAIGALRTPISGKEALLTALALEADPAAGEHRNSLAGYNLREQANWGCSPAEIVKRFEQHLESRFGPGLAKVVAYQLLAMSAPEFLVKDVPPTLVYGSQQWASFSAAVLRREQATPGSSAGLTYAEIMQHDALEPITEAGHSQQQYAAMIAVIDWGIANGVIEQSSDDTYSAAIIDRAAVALQKQVDGLVDAANLIAVPMPTRRELALAQLRRVYGAENEHLFDEKILYRDKWVDAHRFSLLDVYMSGDQYTYWWVSIDARLPTENVRANFRRLPDAEKLFDKKFDAYAQGISKALTTLFQYQLSQLPVEDRHMIEQGEVMVSNFEAPASAPAQNNSKSPLLNYLKDGAFLITATLNGKVELYLYSPSQGGIIKSDAWQGYYLDHYPVRPGHKDYIESRSMVRWKDKGKVVGITYPLFLPPKSKTLKATSPGTHSAPPAGIPSARINEMSKLFSAHVVRSHEQLKVFAKGETELEKRDRVANERFQFILNFVPFYSAIKAFVKGNIGEGIIHAFLDIVGLVVPAVKGGSLAVKAGAKGLSAPLNFLKGFVKTGIKAANPLAAVFDSARSVFNLGKRGVKLLRSTSTPAFDKLRTLGGRNGSFNIPHGTNKELIAEGVYRPVGAHTGDVTALAIQKNGKWYAYDPVSGFPYGAALKGFTPSAKSTFVQAVIHHGVDAAQDVAVKTVAGLTKQRPGLPSRFEPPSTAGLADTDKAGQLTDQALLAHAQKLGRELREAEAALATLEGVQAKDENTEPEHEHLGLLERLDQIEASLSHLEARLDEDAMASRVFFSFRLQVPVDPLHENAARDRMNAIEQRLATVREGLREIQRSQSRAHA